MLEGWGGQQGLSEVGISGEGCWRELRFLLKCVIWFLAAEGAMERRGKQLFAECCSLCRRWALALSEGCHLLSWFSSCKEKGPQKSEAKTSAGVSACIYMCVLCPPLRAAWVHNSSSRTELNNSSVPFLPLSFLSFFSPSWPNQ